MNYALPRCHEKMTDIPQINLACPLVELQVPWNISSPQAEIQKINVWLPKAQPKFHYILTLLDKDQLVYPSASTKRTREFVEKVDHAVASQARMLFYMREHKVRPLALIG